MPPQFSFKDILPVPTNKDFVDIVLLRTQRKTPTVVHAGWQISRIRQFYMRKVKFTQSTFSEKLTAIVDQFPKLDDIHPFYADLINVLYDRDHYKLALGQVNTARQIIDNVAKDYLRLLKFGDSLFRCKQLKRASLGRMCTVMRKQGPTLGYLEEVRKHLARLPAIDPTTRTLLITGYPNVGKSSFMNKVTRADVDVQPYAFTTKSLFVGHMDYKYQRWQVIDTPGILDHPLEERNTIEMQSITALAHLRAAVLFFIDISGQCGFTVDQQLSLFASISPLFANKPLVIVATKIDAQPWETLDAGEKSRINAAVASSKATFCTMSNFTEEGIVGVKTGACEALLVKRVDEKMRGKRVGDVVNRLAIMQPKPRDGRVRDVSIPASVLASRTAEAAADGEAVMKYDDGEEGGESPFSKGPDMVKKWLARDKERVGGGPGVYRPDFTSYYLLRDDEWKTDIVPETMDGKNIADFVDPDILERLLALEEEEEGLLAAAIGAGEEEEEEDDELDEETEKLYSAIQKQRRASITAHKLAMGSTNHPPVPRPKRKDISEKNMAEGLASSGYDESTAAQAARSAIKAQEERGRKRTREQDRREAAGTSTSRGRQAATGDGGEMEEEEEGQQQSGGEGGLGPVRRKPRSASSAKAQRLAISQKLGTSDPKSIARGIMRASRNPFKAAPQALGLKDEDARAKDDRKQRKFRAVAFDGKSGEADRFTPVSKPKWLFAGKMDFKRDRR